MSFIVAEERFVVGVVLGRYAREDCKMEIWSEANAIED